MRTILSEEEDSPAHMMDQETHVLTSVFSDAQVQPTVFSDAPAEMHFRAPPRCTSSDAAVAAVVDILPEVSGSSLLVHTGNAATAEASAGCRTWCSSHGFTSFFAHYDTLPAGLLGVSTALDKDGNPVLSPEGNSREIMHVAEPN